MNSTVIHLLARICTFFLLAPRVASVSFLTQSFVQTRLLPLVVKIYCNFGSDQESTPVCA